MPAVRTGVTPSSQQPPPGLIPCLSKVPSGFNLEYKGNIRAHGWWWHYCVWGRQPWSLLPTTIGDNIPDFVLTEFAQ